MTVFGRSIALRTVVVVSLSATVFAAEPTPPAGSGMDTAAMDRSVVPGEDFYSFANGTWLKGVEIPADRGSYGMGTVVVDRTNLRTVELMQEAARAGAPEGSVSQKIGDYYTSFLDLAAIDALFLKPLQPTLDRIDAITDRKLLSRYIGSTVLADVDAFNNTALYTDNLLGLWVAQDLDDPSRYLPFLLQGGLDMPDRAYYLDDTPRMKEMRDKHVLHVAAMFELAKLPDAQARAARVVALERRIAEAHVSRQDSGDMKKGNNHWPRSAFDVKAPGLDWQELFTAASLSTQTEFVVWQPTAVIGLSALAAQEPLQSWRDYLIFHAIERSSAFLPDAFGNERFAFHGTVLSGTPQRRERAKRAVDVTNAALGDAVGQLYVQKHFPASEKKRAEVMVENIKAAFGRRIDALPWMSPVTKAKAKAKLAVLKVGVGYPDRWRDDSGLRIVKGDAFGNAQRAELYTLKLSLQKLGQPVDRSEWVMRPQTVNAVNLPAMNAMNFPAAILQPPYFDPSRPAAMDYGAIGATIGHEISHSFDDQGALFDATGRLSDWWTPEDFAHFQASGARLVKQYDAYKPFPDLAVNGALTLGENIADVAGLAASYDAYRLSLDGKPAPMVDGLTGDQQFFVSFAQSWRSKLREKSLRQQVLGDSHSPGHYRALTVRNLDAWYAAFDVKPGQALYLTPAERVRVW